MSDLPRPHYEKIEALLRNAKLPAVDRPRLIAMRDQYAKWIVQLDSVALSPEDHTLPLADRAQLLVDNCVPLLNEYKKFVELDITFGSPANFLYRQRGQTKLDNSIIEEFLPHLICKIMKEVCADISLEVGPKKGLFRRIGGVLLADEFKARGVQ